MLIAFEHKTLQQYSDLLSSREPVPGGGSAAALTASLGVGLISMVTQYSIGRKVNTPSVEKKLAKILQASESIRKRLLALTSLDAQAYLAVVAARKEDLKKQQQAAKAAAAVGKEAAKLCYKAIELTPYLVEKGNPYLLSDIEVAVELLWAGFNGSIVMVRVNQ